MTKNEKIILGIISKINTNKDNYKELISLLNNDSKKIANHLVKIEKSSDIDIVNKANFFEGLT